MSLSRERRDRVEPSRAEGFTLLEVLIALGIMGVAITVFSSLFVTSITIDRSNRNGRVAASLAEEHLRNVLQNPGRYEWTSVLDSEPGVLVPLLSEPRNLVPPPIIPTVRRMHNREEALYDQYTWQGYGRMASEGDANIEVTVAIGWVEGPAARPHTFALTGVLPRARVEGLQ